MSPELTTLVMFGALVFFLVIGVPLAWVLSGIAIFMTAYAWNFMALFTFVTNTFGIMWNVMFIALPLFIAMGVVLERSGLAEDLFASMYYWSGRLRGGLAMGTVAISAVFAAMCGVAGAACVAMGMIALPAMEKRGYAKGLALGSVAAPATLGILIPPSIVMVFLGIIGEVSVGRLFLAGVMPGIMLAVMFCLYIGVIGLVSPTSCPSSDLDISLKEKIKSLKSVILPILIIFSVLGSIFSGAATPTEASAVGLLAVLIATIINGRFSFKLLHESCQATFFIVGMILWITIGAVAFSGIFSALGGVEFIKGTLLGLEVSPYFILIGILVMIFLLGMFIDPGGIIWIVCPIAYPIMKDLGFDLIWCSVLMVMGVMLGYITPPFGFNLFYLKSIAPADVRMSDIYRAVMPFILIMVAALVLVFMVPQIALWFPSMMM